MFCNGIIPWLSLQKNLVCINVGSPLSLLLCKHWAVNYVPESECLQYFTGIWLAKNNSLSSLNHHQTSACLALPPYILCYLFSPAQHSDSMPGTNLNTQKSPQSATRAKSNCAQLFPWTGATFGMKPESELAKISEQTLPSPAGSCWSSFNGTVTVRVFPPEQTPDWCIISQRNSAGSSLQCKKRWKPPSFPPCKTI